MHPSLPLPITLALLTALTAAHPTSLPLPLLTRQSQSQSACFTPGTLPLPAEVATSVSTLIPRISCSTTSTTLPGIPDVTSGSTSYSSIDFSQSPLSPLTFALETFATKTPLKDTDLKTFQDELNVYLATEAGVRSVGGGLAIKVPKFFLEMQVSRIQTAQGKPPREAGLQVAHLRDKVTKNAAGEEKALLDRVIALAAELE
ncbi:hypothetical protein NX059_000087 [Plenodomus lindquistii]|nr:hypothetical protein NX059_000087 [Plenodomus lindquistii]